MKILAIRFSALGDVAILAPVVREYALSHPADELTVLSMPSCAPLFDDVAPNVCFLGRDVKNDYKGVMGLYRLFRELRSMRFDYVCDMHDVLRTKVLRGLFHIYGYKVRKINKHRNLRRLLIAPEGRKLLRQLPTAFENYASVLYGSRASQYSNSSQSSASGFSGNSSQSSVFSIGIAPFAAHEGKIYPLDRMERVVQLLVENDANIYLFGSGGRERDTMQRWVERYHNVHLASETCHGLKEELELMSRLHAMVCMDSANMHLASLVGTRVVSIWGPTHPYAGFLGWGQSPEDCIQGNLPCRPCSIYGNKPCLRKDMACMNNISPELIFEKLITHNS